MAKRQCEVDDRGSVDGNVIPSNLRRILVLIRWNAEITKPSGAKRRRTTPKEEKENISKAPVVVENEKGKGREKAKGEKDPKGLVTALKDVKTTALGIAATLKDDAPSEEPITAQEEAPASKGQDDEEVQEGNKEAEAVLPKDGDVAKANKPNAPVDTTRAAEEAGSTEVATAPREEGPTIPATTDNPKKRASRARVADPKTKVVAPKTASKKKTPQARAGVSQEIQGIQLEELCEAVMDLPHDVIYTVRSLVYPLIHLSL